MTFILVKKKRKVVEDKKQKKGIKNKNWELPLKSCHLDLVEPMGSLIWKLGTKVSSFSTNKEE